LIKSWPQLYLKEVYCRPLAIGTKVFTSYTSILDCDARTGSADRLRT